MEAKDVTDVVSLISNDKELHGTLNMSRRVNYQPLSQTHLKVKCYPLDRIRDRRVQESLVVRDLLNVLLGMEGIYIRYNNNFDPNAKPINFFQLNGPDYKIIKNMDPSLKSFTKRITKLGKIYFILTQFSTKLVEKKYGSILQRLCFEIRRFLLDTYLKFIVEKLEYEFNFNESFSIRDMEQLLNDECTCKAQVLYDLVQEISQEMYRRSIINRTEADFDNFMEDLKQEDVERVKDNYLLMTDTRISSIMKGGSILQIVQKRLKQNYGNEKVENFLKTLLQNISKSYCCMLDDWLIDGELDDPYDEFLISNTLQHPKEVVFNSLNSERLWDTIYVIRKDGLLEQFQVKQLQFKILMTGKLLNLFKTSCNIQTTRGILCPDNDISGPLLEIPDGTQLYLYVDKCYERANKLVWSLFVEGYRFKELLSDLQNQLFFRNNVEFQSKFFHRSMVELTKIKSDTNELKLKRNFQYYQKLSKQSNNIILQLMNLKLDTFTTNDLIRQFSKEQSNNENKLLNAKNFTNLKNILIKELNESLVVSNPTKSIQSIHYLQFEIILPYPINCLITKPLMIQYQIIQRQILIIKYYNKLLDDTWIEINKNRIWKYYGFSPELKLWIKKCRILHDRMNHFLKISEEYMMQDVIAFEWQKLIKVVNKDGCNQFFIEIQTKIQDFLINTMSQALLTHFELNQIFQQMLEIIHKFCKFVTSLRKHLCLSTYRLYLDYKEQLENQEFDEVRALKKYQEMVHYLEKISLAFQQHLNAYIEGIKFYTCGGNSTSQLTTMTLVERLSMVSST